VNLKVEDDLPLQKRWWLRLKDVNEMGCPHKLEQYLDEYIAAAGIAEDKKGPLFRAAIGRTGKLSERSMSRVYGARCGKRDGDVAPLHWHPRPGRGYRCSRLRRFRWPFPQILSRCAMQFAGKR
jgi:hypothetical protein